jgi:hypothetical protein
MARGPRKAVAILPESSLRIRGDYCSRLDSPAFLVGWVGSVSKIRPAQWRPCVTAPKVAGAWPLGWQARPVRRVGSIFYRSVDSSLLSQFARHSNVKYGLEPTRCIEEATTELKTTTEGRSEAGLVASWRNRVGRAGAGCRKRPKTISNARLPSHGSSKQNLGNCALRRVWRGSGAIRVSGRKSRPSRSGL